jgi:hypothetical protein
MKRKDDLFEGLEEFDEEMPESKRYKMADDDLSVGVEHALAPMPDDPASRAGGTALVSVVRPHETLFIVQFKSF